jgi:hypothetical protein
MGCNAADRTSQNCRFCTRRMVHRHGCWQGQSRQVRLVINRQQAARYAVSSRVGAPCRNWQVRGRQSERASTACWESWSERLSDVTHGEQGRPGTGPQSWNGSWNGSLDSLSAASVVSAMIRAIGAASGCATRDRAPRNA